MYQNTAYVHENHSFWINLKIDNRCGQYSTYKLTWSQQYKHDSGPWHTQDIPLCYHTSDELLHRKLEFLRSSLDYQSNEKITHITKSCCYIFNYCALCCNLSIKLNMYICIDIYLYVNLTFVMVTVLRQHHTFRHTNRCSWESANICERGNVSTPNGKQPSRCECLSIYKLVLVRDVWTTREFFLLSFSYQEHKTKTR